MLEQKINDLTAAVNQLNETIQTLISSLGVKPSIAEPVEPEPAPAPKSPKPLKTPKEEPVPAPPTPQVTLTHEEVQDLCLELIRFDRSLKPDIQTCIGSFADAQKLQDIPLSDLPALQAKLLKLKDQR